jgi:hypothetical protein
MVEKYKKKKLEKYKSKNELEDRLEDHALKNFCILQVSIRMNIFLNFINSHSIDTALYMEHSQNKLTTK